MSSKILLLLCLVQFAHAAGSSFASNNPFGSVLSSVLLCFAGSVIQNLMLGIPLAKPFENSNLILILILIWYLMHFCPLDLFTRLLTFIPIRVALIVLKEVYRIKCILFGLKLAASLFPNAWFVIIAGGSIRGCGSMVLKPFVHQIVGLGTPRIEFHRPTFTTKFSILMSCVFTLQVKGMLNVNLSSLSLIFTVLMLTFQLLFLFTDQTDPLAPLENSLAAIFLRHPDQTASTSGNERKKKSD
ncbi:trimeric intracellular cation channel type [Paramuricea clavata]|uniref:Trimeric intracellular cation channel type n=2 Tax=Paramuricea clavata TaxID=317549 RepID=A0A6S7FHD3_PARCT|nr:trimeric intracellular cation channel type [Paramuricea clavata]